MGLSLDVSVPALTVFIQGIVSFFSPCVLPLIPLYMGYLAGGTIVYNEDGTLEYPRKKVLINTLCFVLGISFTFVLLGLGFSVLGQFFSANQKVFSVIAGIVMMAFGLYMIGIFGKSRVVETEHRLPFRLDKFAMNPLVALVLGFTFSFAWTPCVGPVLASVLLMASSSASALYGFVLVGVYTLGFVLPFLAVGLFTNEVLRFFKKHTNMVKYTVKIGGALLIVMGVMTLTGWMNGLSSYLSSFGETPSVSQTQEATEDKQDNQHDDNNTTDNKSEASSGQPEDKTGAAPDENTSSADQSRIAPFADVALEDQYGTTHTLSQYQGKVILLNFFATWCGPCKQEIPDIEALYQEYGENTQDLVVLGIANPATEGNATAADVSVEELQAFIEEQGITYPVLMDTTGKFFSAYGISAFPTTFMISANGEVYGYVTGALSATLLQDIVDQTFEGQGAN
ncbi:cytochrome c biogenesis protein/redoxin [Adlercreutzia agrestimuris]|uniref:cytochrome c biogenesis protein/redoxin n=1 Tax=Adlercreutzia agrestimuris TaxID=2941324 RepID=UPI00203DD720|nr:cytochrome c biogenesis protein/redoxin [Adlercreutzia agrestimuris]